MKLNNKRGVSGVITAVLLILLVIAAIGILWVVVQNFITQGADTIPGASDCLTNQLSIESAVYGTAGTNLTVRVKRIGGDADISSLSFFIDGAVPTTPLSGSTPTTGETQTFFTDDAASQPAKVEVSAVIAGRTCQSTESGVTTTA